MNKRFSWRRISLYSKLAVSIALTLIVTFLVVFTITQNRLKEDQSTYAVESKLIEVENSVSRMELILSQLENQADTIYSNSSLYQLLSGEELSEEEANNAAWYLRTILYTTSGRLVDQIYVDHIASDQGIVITASDIQVVRSTRHDDSDIAYALGGTSYGYGPHTMTDYSGTAESECPMVFSFRKKIYNTTTSMKMGSITFDIDVQALQKAMFSGESDRGFLSYLYGGENIIIAGSNCDDLGSEEIKAIKKLCVREGWGRYPQDGADDYVFGEQFSIGGQEFYYVRFIPEDEVFRHSAERQKENALIMLGGGLLCLLAALLLARLVTRPLRQVDKALIRMTDKRELSYRIRQEVSYSGDDEIGRVITQTDHLLDMIERQFHRQAVMRDKQRRAEARMLQAQINPHFLYNALQSIASLALQHGEEEVFDYISLLGTMMHYCMNLDSEATLDDEFQYVEGYLSLQNIRFGNSLDMQIRLDPGAASVLVPKMILQPIVENAYKHGRIFQRKNSRVLISAQQTQESGVRELILEVNDNGCGCTAEQLEQINRTLSGADGDSMSVKNEHLGITNVYQRLNLFFDGNVVMRANSAPEEGFGVEIRIRMRD